MAANDATQVASQTGNNSSDPSPKQKSAAAAAAAAANVSQPSLTPEEFQEALDQLKLFLATAPANWDPSETIKRFQLPTTGEYVSCIFWNNLFYITGTDIVRSLVFRFQAFGRPVKNLKKFEEGIFSDLRNLKPGIDATLEEPRSEFLDMLYKKNCIRTQKKQKVFFWFSVPHDRLFMDALERDLKREALGVEPTTVALNPLPLMPTLELAKKQCMPVTDVIKASLMTADLAASNPAIHSIPESTPITHDEPVQFHIQPPVDDHTKPAYQPLFQSFMPSPAPSVSSPCLTTAASPVLSETSPSLESEGEDGLNHQVGLDGEFALPPTAVSNNGSMFGMFSLFEGTNTNNKVRRRGTHPGVYSPQSKIKLENSQSATDFPTPPSTTGAPTGPFRSPSFSEPMESSPLRPRDREEDRRNFTCTFDSCGRRFKRYEHLRRHMRCHTGERPYVCPVDGCNRGFARSDNLSQHMRVHGAAYLMDPQQPQSAPGSPLLGTGLDYAESPLLSAVQSPLLHATQSLPGSPILHQMHSPMMSPVIGLPQAQSLPGSPMMHGLASPALTALPGSPMIGVDHATMMAMTPHLGHSPHIGTPIPATSQPLNSSALDALDSMSIAMALNAAAPQLDGNFTTLPDETDTLDIPAISAALGIPNFTGLDNGMMGFSHMSHFGDIHA